MNVGGGVYPPDDDDDDDDGNDGASPSLETPRRSGVGVVVTGGDVSGRVRRGSIGTSMGKSLGTTASMTRTSKNLSLRTDLLLSMRR